METPSNEEWHKAQSARISQLAAEMVKLFVLDYKTLQSDEYEATRQEYLWQEHVKSEHDKFDPPEYGDHRNG